MSKELQPNTLEILRNRYFLKNETGEVIEDFEGMCRRVAHYIAEAEPDDPSGRRTAIEQEFYQMMVEQKFMPNSPTLFNAGTPHPMLSACFILPVRDSIREIYKAVEDGAVIEKFGGGIGMDFSRVRPRGTLTSTGGIASGPISFMNAFQAMSDTFKQGGKRRGAMMAMLQVDHPEILDFIDCKLRTLPERVKFLEEKYGVSEALSRAVVQELAWQAPFNGFNITVKLTDEFMEAVERDRLYPLRDPRGGFWAGEIRDPQGEIKPQPMHEGNAKVGVGLPARPVWRRIIESAWRSAEPGVAFIDRINADNPVRSLGAIHSSNPCGEYWQVDYNSCNLGSINLSSFVTSGNDAEAPWLQKIDWNGLAKVVRTATRFLDYVITQSEYPIPEIEEVTRKSRPIGLGVMGFADLLLKLGIRYGCPESATVAEQVMQWIQYWAWVESTELAQQFGPFPELDENRGYFDPKITRLAEEFRAAFAEEKSTTLEPNHSIHRLEELYRRCGLRNCHVTVQAPTGSISLIAECSSGIEPIFAFEYTRQDSIGTRTYQHPTMAAWRKKHHEEPLPDSFVDASQVKPEEHVLIQTAFQKHVDNAVSKTVNLPSGATLDDIEKIYRLAYEKGLKSVTVYVEGTREGVLLRDVSKSGLSAAGAREGEVRPALTTESAESHIRRPEFLSGITRKIRTPFGTVYVTVNYDTRHKQITEIFVRESSGNEAWELVGRLLSLLLRSGVPLERP